LADISLPNADLLSRRLRDIASRQPSGSIDDLELRHLVEVASNHALLLSDIYRDNRLAQVVEDFISRGLRYFTDLHARQQEVASEIITQIRRIPDEMKVIGDKCLFDVGLVGRQVHGGHDLSALGKRSYETAAELLQIFAEDRRLREFFRQNCLWNLPIEEEILFLKHCGVRFPMHAEMLRQLHLFDHNPLDSTSPLGPVTHHVEREPKMDLPTGSDPHNERSVSPTNRPRKPSDLAPHAPVTPDLEGSGLDALSTRRAPDTVYSGGLMGERPELLPEEPGPLPGLSDMDRLPRKDLLSLYERMLLFSGLDIENLRNELKDSVIDQQEAVDSLCDELSLYATGTQSLSRPASYFFVGPTGVGKNHMVESLVRALEKRWDFTIPMLQLEGPQYTYPSDINELKGAARGFIRSDEEGILTEFYNRSSQSPFSVILVDEVEKSHPQLRKFFLSLMDRGTTMDNRGQVLNFVNTMIVYTSNVGYSRLQTSANPIGFHDEVTQLAIRENEVMRDLKKILSPEFVNRLTVIKFTPLTRASIDRIFDLEFEKIASRYMTMHGLELTATPAARDELICRGFNPEFGARPMARLLNVICNIEVSKKLKRDDARSMRADRSLREYIREVKEGKRAYDAVSVQRRVMGTARLQVPYRGIAVDYDGGEFVYLPQGRERGTH